jgi:hypothetical protein
MASVVQRIWNRYATNSNMRSITKMPERSPLTKHALFITVVAFTTPAHALYFLGYEFGKKYIQPNKPADQKGPLVHFSAGLVAECMGALIWTPMVRLNPDLLLKKIGSNFFGCYRTQFANIKSILGRSKAKITNTTRHSQVQEFVARHYDDRKTRRNSRTL